MRDLVELVSTGYSLTLRTQSSSYRGLLNPVPGDRHSYWEYLCGYRFCVGESGRALRIGELDSAEELGGSTPSPLNDGDIVEIPPPFEFL